MDHKSGCPRYPLLRYNPKVLESLLLEHDCVNWGCATFRPRARRFMHMKDPSSVSHYLLLQRRMLDVFLTVSCHESNFDVYSVVMESLITEAGSFFDSLCQTFIREEHQAGRIFKNEAMVQDFGAKAMSGGTYFNMGDYRTLLDAEFGFSGREVNLNSYEDRLYSNPLQFSPDQIDGCRLSPLKEWAIGNRPDWWGVFTGLKHDRVAHHKKATLRHAIHALGAVFILITEREMAAFKAGHISPEVYTLFFPKYWKWKGRVAVMGFTWE